MNSARVAVMLAYVRRARIGSSMRKSFVVLTFPPPCGGCTVPRLTRARTDFESAMADRAGPSYPGLMSAVRAATALSALALALLSGYAAPAGAKPYTSTPGPTRSDASFVATYSGAGSYATRFHATPPNDGGKPDTNDARDSSTQAWSIKFPKALA